MSKKIGSITIYTVQELSKMLDVTTVTLRTYIRRGDLKARKTGGTWFVSEGSLRNFFFDNPETPPKKKRKK